MEKIVIFGTGESAKKLIKALKKSNTNIIAYADNDFNKHGKKLNDIIILNPKDLDNIDFDFIVISNIKFESIKKQLIDIGVEENKIFAYFDDTEIEKEDFEKIFISGVYIRDNMKLKLEQLTIKAANLPYEKYEEIKKRNINVKTIEETIDKLIEGDMSISRFGDGEMKLIAGKDIGFQKASAKLSERLKEVLCSKEDNLMVGILNVFGNLSMYTEELQDYFRKYLYEYDREFQFGVMDLNKEYYDAFITRPYISYKDRSHASDIFKKFKMLWEGKEVLVVEGDRTRLGCGNDLFSNVKKCKRIVCPNEDAFERYDEILTAIISNVDNALVLLALGPTATILAYDLAKRGIRTLDIGHIDLEYEWYRMGAEKKVIVKNKYTNEVFGGNEQSYIEDKKYESEIICNI